MQILKFYGWYLATFLWLMLVAAIGGSAYAWGFYAPEIMGDLGLSAADIGAVSGATVIVFSISAPIAGFLIMRYGCRKVMPVGAVSSALGCIVIATSNDIWQFFLGYAILINGIGYLNSSLASQTLITAWFKQYRARVLAGLSTAISLGGFIWIQIHNQVLQFWDWRTGWFIASAVSIAIAIGAVLVVRNRPEDLGQFPDGAARSAQDAASPPHVSKPRPSPLAFRSIWSRIWSPQFIILVLVGVVLVAPSGLVLVHGRLHLEGLGLSQNQAVSVLSISALVGLSGRLMSGFADVVHPKLLLMGAVTAQALGSFGMIFASNIVVAYFSVGAIGIGIGAGMQTITVLIARYFGREAFSSTQGLRTFAAGAFNATIPWAVGLSADLTGSYTLALTVEGFALIIVGVVAALFLKERTQAKNASVLEADNIQHSATAKNQLDAPTRGTGER